MSNWLGHLLAMHHDLANHAPRPKAGDRLVLAGIEALRKATWWPGGEPEA